MPVSWKQSERDGTNRQNSTDGRMGVWRFSILAKVCSLSMLLRRERLLFGCSSSLSQSILPLMSQIDEETVRFLPVGTASVILVVFVCLCVVFQMLGVPVTLLDLLTSDAPVESLSEDFSIPPSMPEPGTPDRSRFTAESQSFLHFPIFSTAVFHPPQS